MSNPSTSEFHPIAIQLIEKGYQVDSVFSYYDLIPFVVKYLFRKNTLTLGWLFIMLAFFAGWIWVIATGMISGDFTLGSILIDSGLGLLLTLALIPVHELLHGIAYRICGAKSVSYKANWKQLYFMAVADGFVTHKKPFYFIGSLPFIVISLGMIAALFVVDPHNQVMLIAALWIHASMCAGDIGLMSFFKENRDRDVVTFDDVTAGMAYFLSKPDSEAV